jgi:hypothetical protein
MDASTIRYSNHIHIYHGFEKWNKSIWYWMHFRFNNINVSEKYKSYPAQKSMNYKIIKRMYYKIYKHHAYDYSLLILPIISFFVASTFSKD